jgi:hypothetical protein
VHLSIGLCVQNILIFNHRLHRALQPRLSLAINDHTFQLVEERLKLLQYEGLVALSCDDTKLLSSLRPYYDYRLKGYYVVGHVGEPYQIANVEAF